jgi:hypothetical protein
VRTKVTLLLIFLNVALFFFIFKFERHWRIEAQSLETRRRVLGPEASDIRSVQVTSADPSGSFLLVRQRDTWSLRQPLEWPANPHAASAIVNELQLLEHEASFRVADLSKNSQSLADFGLDNPKITVTFSSTAPAALGAPPAPGTSLKIGDATKDGKRLYILSANGERVHVVKRGLLDTLTTPLAQIRADTLLSVRVFEARSLIIQTTADATRSNLGLRVRIRRDGTRWTFDAPITARASKTAIELTLNELNALHAKSFPATPNGALPSGTSTLKITIEGNGRQEILYLGDAVNPSATSSSSSSNEFYAQLEGRNALFTVIVPIPLITALRNAQETLREKRLLDFEISGVTAVTLAAPVQPNLAPLTLQRLEPSAGQLTTTPSWQIVRRSENAAAGAQTLPADRASVQRLLELLSLLSAQKFTSDAPTSADLEEWGFNRPAREITLTALGLTAPVILRLGTDVAKNVYARIGTQSDAGTSIYQVPAEILSELTIAASAWRDRAIAEPLPPTTHISHLRLSEVESKQELLATTADATLAATGVVRDPAAVRTILGALRTLRAREFVAGGFTDRVAGAGEDRPWFYLIEATLTTAGLTSGAPANILKLYLTERLGGNQQFGGIKELDTVFALEQPLVDALWAAVYGPRDPGPRREPQK